jgi:hypothetical protein
MNLFFNRFQQQPSQSNFETPAGLVKDSTGMFLEPTSGQYYTPYSAPAATGISGMGGNNFMGGGMFGNAPRAPQGLTQFGGRSFVPFTGNMAGISAGKRSVVDSLMGNRQPFEYNAQSLAQLFPMLQGGAPMQGMDMQPSAGAGRFMSGLLGAMPTPVSSETTTAPASSGAGRFL